MCWRPEMCIVQYSKVISSAAKGLLQRADEKCADLWGPRKESGNWLLVQVNHCHPTEAWAAARPWIPIQSHWVHAELAESVGCSEECQFGMHRSDLTLSLAFRCSALASLWAFSSSSSMSSASGSPTMAWKVHSLSPCAEHYPGLTWVCNLLFCCSSYSCPHLVFHTFPALGRQLCHCHLPHICCSVLLDADPWSSHCWLLAGKV